MAGIEQIEGSRLVLRLIRPEDADYLYGLRMNPSYNKHLSQLNGTVEDQRRWIENYKTREAAGQELYYLISRHDGVNCGVVRLYGIEQEQFTWGSWILDHNKPAKAALESAVLSFGIGFENLAKKRALIDVRRDNVHAQAFYRRIGMIETHSDAQDIFFTYTRETFLRDRDRHFATLTKGGHDDAKPRYNSGLFDPLRAQTGK